MSNQLNEIHTMLEALLKSSNHIHWIGGYVYGRTSQDDPFVILYPASDMLKEKAVRVYEHDFRKLPPFIATDNVPADTENNPNKTQAQKSRIYHTCPLFKICTYDGKDTQMGKEKRFGGVLRVTDRMPNAPSVSEASPTAVSQPAAKPAAAPAANANGRSKTDHFLQVGDEVMVRGKKDEKPGTILDTNGGELFTVSVDGHQLKVGADKLRLIPSAS